MKIEIWSDVICPWCYIGKRRFEQALAQFGQHENVSIIWRSFELDPNAPPQYPGTLEEMLSRKYGVSPQDREPKEGTQSTGVELFWNPKYREPKVPESNCFCRRKLMKTPKENLA